MSSTRRAWIAAVTVGAVQGLKDQGLCKWNQTLGSIQQYANKTNYTGAAASFSLYRRQLCSSSSSVFSSGIVQIQERTKASEESLRKVMYLSCWGPN